MKAIWDGKLDKAKQLMLQGPQLLPQAKTADGRTALHYAAWRGHVVIVRYLVDQGAVINQQVDRMSGGPPVGW